MTVTLLFIRTAIPAARGSTEGTRSIHREIVKSGTAAVMLH
jgi:hypothetical protein